MQVPSREAFEEYIVETTDLGRNLLLASGVDGRWRPAAGRELQDTEVVLARLYAKADEAFANIEGMEASRWLHSRKTERAWASVHGRRNPRMARDRLTPSELAQTMLSAVSEPVTIESMSPSFRARDDAAFRVEEMNSPDGVRRRLGDRVIAYCSRSWFAFPRSLMIAFIGYFYDQAWKKYAEKTETKALNARKVLDALATLDDDLLLASFGVRSPLLMGRATREKLERLASMEGVEAPLGRLDGTARERALAFELWLAFRKFYRANKTNAIYEFLVIDDIERPPASLKQVQGWVKRWNDGSSHRYPASSPWGR